MDRLMHVRGAGGGQHRKARQPLEETQTRLVIRKEAERGVREV